MSLITLRTLKAKCLREQIETIERLAERNLDLAEKMRALFEARSESSIFHVSLVLDSRKIVQVALLAVVADDIATLPNQGIRKPYHSRLDQLCLHFGIDPSDLSMMIRHASYIESLVAERPESSADDLHKV